MIQNDCDECGNKASPLHKYDVKTSGEHIYLCTNCFEKVNPQEICSNCKEKNDSEDMVNYKGERVCEGCAENQAFFAEHDDPHGRNWEV